VQCGRQPLQRDGQSLTSEAVETVMSAGFQVAVSCDNRGLRARVHPLRIPRLMAREESGAELTERLSKMRPRRLKPPLYE